MVNITHSRCIRALQEPYCPTCGRRLLPSMYQNELYLNDGSEEAVLVHTCIRCDDHFREYLQNATTCEYLISDFMDYMHDAHPCAYRMWGNTK